MDESHLARIKKRGRKSQQRRHYHLHEQIEHHELKGPEIRFSMGKERARTNRREDVQIHTKN
jgi:hypothetical protein